MSKTYTKTGDEGTTSLIGGKRVPKYDERVEAYGTVDELSAFLGVLSDHQDISDELKRLFSHIQDRLFTLESHFAMDAESEVCKMIPSLTEADLTFVERQIDSMNTVLPPLKSFVIPGGESRASASHVCRTVCRRAERQAWRLAAKYPVDRVDLKYLNRLSDFFFVLARYFDYQFGHIESCWEPVE